MWLELYLAAEHLIQALPVQDGDEGANVRVVEGLEAVLGVGT